MKTWLLLLLAFCSPAFANDFATLCADRVAIERVYYNHRLGNKRPFEETLPPVLVEKRVREDLHKEAVLKKVYGIAVTPAMLAAEVQRINTTTRAPDVLAELKAALGNDANRFAQTVAKPILVERLLRDKFENDDALHAGIRREMENTRAALTNAAAARRRSRDDEAPSSKDETATDDLVRKLLSLLEQTHSNAVTETTWRMTCRPLATNAPTADELDIKRRFGPNARILSTPGEAESGFYFEDLPPDLQRVLRVQLREPGDVSAVIETPGGFLLYLAEAKTPDLLKVATLSLPKRDYEQWLAEQNKDSK